VTGAAGKTTLHATSVALNGRGMLIVGPSGSGKSSLALRLMSLGARLVADDRTAVSRQGDTLVAECPPAGRGLIEARGVGLLRADPCDAADLALVVDLSQPEADRLPPVRHITILGVSLPLVHKSAHDHFADAMMLYLRHGRHA